MKEYKSMIVNPEMAKKFLEMNTKNRKPSNSRVKEYARDMIRGDWNEDNDDPITINKFNVLENGQHRLMAVIKANKPIRFLVVTGGEPAGETYDRGRPRSVNDSLAISGRVEQAQLCKQVAVVRLLGRFGYKQQLLTDKEIERYLIEYGDDILEALRISAHGKRKGITNRKEIHLATYCALRNGVKSYELEPFFTALNTGFMSTQRQSPAVVLRNAIIDGKITSEVNRGFSKELFLTTELAIRDYLSGTARVKKYFVSDKTKSIFLPLVAKADRDYFNVEGIHEETV